MADTRPLYTNHPTNGERINIINTGVITPLPPNLFHDDFIRANGPIGYPWRGVRNTMLIAGNRAVPSVSGDDCIVALDCGAGRQDCTLRARVTCTGTAGAFIAFHILDKDHYTFAQVRASDGKVSLQTKNFGYLLLAESPITYVDDGELKVTFNLTNMKVYYNGALVINADFNYVITLPLHGFGAQAGASFSYFAVEP